MGGTLLLRKIVTGLMLVSVALGTTACSLTDNVASLTPYSPSDGQQVTLENVKARNFIYLVSESGQGYLIGSLVNSSNQDRAVKLEYVSSQGGSRSEFLFNIPAGAKIDLGYNGGEPVLVPVVETPGQTAQFYLLESETESDSFRVPVLDGTLAEYRALLEQLEAQG